MALKCYKKDFINNSGNVSVTYQIPNPTMTLLILGNYSQKITKPVCSGDTIVVGENIKSCKDHSGANCKHKNGILIQSPAENPNPYVDIKFKKAF